MRQIVGQRPDASEHWEEVGHGVGQGVPDRERFRRRLAPQERRLEFEKGDDEGVAVARGSPLDDPDLKPDALFSKQPRLTLQALNERPQVAVVDRTQDLLHQECLPRAGRLGAYKGQ